MKKTISLIVLMITLTIFAFSYPFLDIPTSSVIPDGTFQVTSINGFGVSNNSMMIGLLNIYQIGFKNSGFLTQIQFLKSPLELSIGTLIGEENSFFLTGGKDFDLVKTSAGISYYPKTSDLSTQTNFSIYMSVLIPIQIGDVRFEYKKSTYNVNSFAFGITSKFAPNDNLKWLFNSITIAGGLGWGFPNSSHSFFPSETYFVVEYSKSLK